MPARENFVSTFWITSSLALLASVLVAPPRTSGIVIVSPRPDSPRCHFALLPSQTTRVAAAPIGKNAGQVLALDTEEEEKDDDQEFDGIVPYVLVRDTPPRSFSGVAYQGLFASHLTRAYFPLLC